MKNTTRVAVVICLLLTGMNTQSFAIPPSTPFTHNSDTGSLLPKNAPPAVHYLRLNEVKVRTARDFISRYPYITDAKWIRSDYGYVALFFEGEIINKAHYDRGGFYINTIRYFVDNHIPERLKLRIQKAFAGYSILSFTEVVTEKGSSFHMNIKSSERIKSLIVTAENIEVIDDFRHTPSKL